MAIASVASREGEVEDGAALRVGRAHSRPPWASTIVRAMLSPMPKPSGLVVMKGSKIFASLPGGSPRPRSETATSTAPSPADVRNAMSAASAGKACHGFDGVGQEIDEDLLDLHPVHRGPVARRRRTTFRTRHPGLPHLDGDQPQGLFHDLFDAARGVRRIAALRKRPQALHDFGGRQGRCRRSPRSIRARCPGRADPLRPARCARPWHS